MSNPSPSHLSTKSFTRILLALLSSAALVQVGLGASMTAPAVPCATPGCLDESFGAAGVAQFDLSPSSEFSQDIAVDPAGRIVSVGSGSLSATYSTMLITRVLANGTLDTSFGSTGDGVVRPQFTAAEDQEQATAVGIAPDLDADVDDFDIVVAGSVVVAPPKGNKAAISACAVARLNSDGSFETDFGTGGQLLMAFDPGHSARCNAIAVDHSNTASFGRLVVAGQSDNVAALARLDGDGDLDATFGVGGSGTVITNETDGAGAYSVRVDVNGRVLISTRSRVLRRMWDGSADLSFNGSGRVDTGLTNGGWGGLALDSNGRIIVVGEYSTTVQTSLKPARYTTTADIGVVAIQDNGQRDLSFGLNGLATIDLGSSTDFATGVAVDDAGRAIVTGWNSVSKTFIVARLSPSGVLDSSFAAGGVASNPIDPQGARNAAVIATADGIVVGGQAGPAERTTLARYLH